LNVDLGPVLSSVLAALTHAGVGAAVFGIVDGRMVKWYINDPAVRSIGLTVDEWLAKPIGHGIAAQDRDRLVQMLQRFVAGTPVPATIEIALLHRDGHEVRQEQVLARTTVPGGDALLVILRDVGSSLRGQLSLLEADRLSLVGAVAAGFAHETNNPLTSVLLNLRSLRKQVTANMPAPADAAALRCLDDLATGSERIASNVRALQTLATRGAVRSIDVAAVVSAVLRLAAPTLEPRAHVIRQMFPTAPVIGEESRVAQGVLAMLLFSCSGFDTETTAISSRIVVAVEERGGSVVIEVSDNGRELGADEIDRAFDPFFRSSARGAGVGVGLSVARSVATALNGEVALAPRPGGGAVITMQLPRAPDS
jgi:signal transduction histidine kinase